MKPKRRIIYCDVQSTPTTSRTGFMRNRRRSKPHLVTFLRKAGIAKELKEFEQDEQHETSSSSVAEADTSVGTTSQMTNDDSGIDVSQENSTSGHSTAENSTAEHSTSEHSYFLRKRGKVAYY